MPRRPVRRKDRAVSPVIATIILVAIAIVMAIAVAYWALGLGGTFTRYEKIEIMSMYAVSDDSLKYCNASATWEVTGWNITAKLRNTGSATATINLILISGRPVDIFNGTTTSTTFDITDGAELSTGLVYAWVLINDKPLSQALPITINPGEERALKITIPKATFADITFVPGMSVEVTFHTASGSDYPKVVILP
jgi:flagellin-like protein